MHNCMIIHFNYLGHRQKDDYPTHTFQLQLQVTHIALESQTSKRS